MASFNLLEKWFGKEPDMDTFVEAKRQFIELERARKEAQMQRDKAMHEAMMRRSQLQPDKIWVDDFSSYEEAIFEKIKKGGFNPTDMDKLRMIQELRQGEYKKAHPQETQEVKVDPVQQAIDEEVAKLTNGA